MMPRSARIWKNFSGGALLAANKSVSAQEVLVPSVIKYFHSLFCDFKKTSKKTSTVMNKKKKNIKNNKRVLFFINNHFTSLYNNAYLNENN